MFKKVIFSLILLFLLSGCTQLANYEQCDCSKEESDSNLTMGKQSALYLGDTTEQDGYSLSAVKIEDPVDPKDYMIIYEGHPQEMRLVAVEILVGNVSGEPIKPNPAAAVLVDDEGTIYPCALGSREGQLEWTIGVLAGEKLRGWVGFEIPINAHPAKVGIEIGGSELRAGLTSPP